MAGPAHGFDGELVLESTATTDPITDGKPRYLRYPGDPNAILVRPPGSLCQDTTTPALWFATETPGVWTQVAGGIPPARPGVGSLQPVGMMFFDFPSQNATTNIAVLQKMEIIDAWAIKRDAEGAGADAISMALDRVGLPPHLVAIFDLAPALVGAKIYQGSGSGSPGALPGNNWGIGAAPFDNLIVDVGDEIRFSQSLITNNACSVFILAVARD